MHIKFDCKTTRIVLYYNNVSCHEKVCLSSFHVMTYEFSIKRFT